MKKLFAVFSLLAMVLAGVQFASADTDTCINLTQDMGIGSTDANSNGQVSILQNYLNSKGYIKFKTDSTGAIIGLGNFGAQTARAVMGFQGAYSIAQSGYVGPITRANIKSLTCAVGVAQTYVNNITETPATMSTAAHNFLTFSSPKNGDLVIKGEKDLSVDWTLDPNVTSVFPADHTRINADLIGTDGQVIDFVGHGVSLANSKGDRRISGNFQGTLKNSTKAGGNHNAGDPIPSGGYKIRASLVYTPSMPLCTTTVTHGCVTSYSAADQALIDLAKTYGSDSQWFYVTDPAPKPNIQTSISDRTIPTSQPVTISWSANQASTNCKFTDVIASTTVSILASGSKTVTPFASTSTYKISCDLTSAWPFPGLTYTTTEEKSMRVFVADGVTVPVLNRITPRDGNTRTIFTIYGKNLGGVTNVQLYSASGTLAQSLAPSSVSSTELTFQVKNRFFASGIYSVGVITSTCGAGCSNDRVSITFDGRDNVCSGTSTDASCNTLYNCNGVISHDPCTQTSTNTNNSIAQIPACPDSATGCGSFGCPDSTNCQPLPCPTTGSCGTTSLSTNQIKVTNTKLSMTYGLASEASLDATSQVYIQAGNVKVDIAKPGYFQPSMSMFSFDLYKSSDEWANVSGSMISVKASGDVIDNGTSWSVSPGKRATFMLTKSYNPKLLFAGMYYAKASVISSGSVNLANSKSNTVNVFGEESPYISSAVQNGDGTITVTGARLNLADNYLQIDGMGNSMISKFNPSATSFTFNASNYQLSSGSHTIQITNSRTGNSNFVSVSNTVTSSSVTARAVSGPSIALRYDSSSKESSLIGTASVQINAGASNLTIIKQNTYVGDQTGVGFFAGTATNSVGGNSTGGVISVKQSDTGATEQPDRWIIPAGKSATFTVTTTFNPKIMFAGSYHFVPGFYIGNSGIGNILSAKDGNSVTIVGETSPYISSAAVDSSGQVTIVGQRLNLSNNRVVIDGNDINYPIFKATPTSISFNVSAFNIGTGTHTLQIKNTVTGDSNYVGFLVSTDPTPSSSARLITPNGGEKIVIGNPYAITWTSGDIGNLQINLVKQGVSSPYGGAAECAIAVLIPSTTHSYTWTPRVTDGCPNMPNGLDLNASYKIELRSNVTANGSTLADGSDGSFSFTAGGQATLSVAKTSGFVSATVVPLSTGVKIGSFTVQTNNESVKIAQINANLNPTGYSLNNLSNLNIKVNGALVGTPIGTPTMNTSGFIFPDITVPANNVRTFDVYADIGGATFGSVTTGMTVFYRGLDNVIKAVSADGVAITTVVNTVVCNSEQHLVNGQCIQNTAPYTCLDGTVVQIPMPALPSESSCPTLQTGIVTISSLSPSTGPAGTTVTINGSRFTNTNNTILMDYGSNSWFKLADKLSASGNALTITLPTMVPCPTYRSGGVGCPVPSPLMGTHTLYVVNSSGISNGATFAVNETQVSAPVTGSIYANPVSCSIPSGASTCTVYLTWSTQNTSSAQVTKIPKGDTATVISNLLSSTNYPVSVGQGTTNFSLDTKGNTQSYTNTVTASCANGLVWNGTRCESGVTGIPITDPLSGSQQAIAYGVYKGVNGQVEVTLPSSVNGKVLVLTAYDDVTWVINNPNGIRPSKVIAIGYNPQTVTGLSGVDIESHSYKTDRIYKYAYSNSGSSFNSLVTWLAGKGITLTADNFKGAYSSGTFSLGSFGQVLGATSICTDLAYNFHRGNESLSTKKLQNFLISKGYMDGDVTGFYGDMTVSAVKEYQGAKGLPVTGMVYDVTRAAIKAETCGE